MQLMAGLSNPDHPSRLPADPAPASCPPRSPSDRRSTPARPRGPSPRTRSARSGLTRASSRLGARDGAAWGSYVARRDARRMVRPSRPPRMPERHRGGDKSRLKTRSVGTGLRVLLGWPEDLCLRRSHRGLEQRQPPSRHPAQGPEPGSSVHTGQPGHLAPVLPPRMDGASGGAPSSSRWPARASGPRRPSGATPLRA